MMAAMIVATPSLLINGPIYRPTAMRAANGVAMMANAETYSKLKSLIDQWDDEQDGDCTECMQGAELEFLADRVETCGEEECSALLPDMMELFDAVLADCDEACVTVQKMQKKLSELS